jgi:hypothetical protein
MTFLEFKAEFENALKFVRLHGWVVQSEEMIGSLRQVLASAGGDVDFYLSAILDSLQTASTTQEKLFSLCLLRDSRVTADAIAGLLFEHLQGKFSSTDGQFFTRQFFRNGPVLPKEVSRQITDRVYLTYQRAILQAMKIEQFESSYGADQIVLFMTQLLCRIDLNEQNRAILYLLLSRIDAPLPDFLNRAVVRAMSELQDTIQDVELRQDRVLSEEHPNSPSVSSNDPWSPRQRQEAKSAQAPLPLHSPETGRRFDDPESKLEAPAERTIPMAGKPEPQKNPAGRPLWNELSARSPISDQPGPRTASKTAPPPPRPTLGLDATMNSAAAPIGKVQPPQESPERKPGKDTNLDWETPGRTAAKTLDSVPGRSRFVIRFDQDRTGLSSLLNLLSEGPVAEGPVSEAAPQVQTPKEEDAPVPQEDQISPPRRGPKKRPWWWIGGIAIGLAAVLILIWHPQKPSAPVSPPLAPSVVSTPAVPVEPIDDLDIRVESKGKYWYPHPGQSLWRLYAHLRAVSDPGPGSWTAFQARLLSLNPSLVQADLIYPAKALLFDH